MFRFFVEQKEGNSFILTKETVQHMKVARVLNEEFICIYEGKFYVCTYKDGLANIKEELDENHEFDEPVIIAAAIIDTKRFEWLIQKAAELGATALYPVITKNVSKKISGDINKKVERWNTIALNASEQAFRNKRLWVKYPTEYKDILSSQGMKHKFIAHEKYSDGVPSTLPTHSIFLVGPEGGFTEEEVEMANNAGYKSISLGKRILRAETASLAILAKIQE